MKKLLFGNLIAVLAVASFTGCNDAAKNTNANRAVTNANTTVNANTANSNMSNMNSSNANMSNMNNAVSSVSDRFMTEAAQGGMMEIALGKLAATKAQNPEIKAFGQRMVVDHGKAGEELKALAAKKKVTLPTDMAGGAKETVERLSKLSGAQFDDEYVELMVDDHKGDLDAFEDQQGSDDADVKAFADKYTPIIKSHYDTIKAISDKMK